MAKEKTVFVCASCGYETPRWLGKLDWYINDNHRLELTALQDRNRQHDERSGFDYQTLARVGGSVERKGAGTATGLAALAMVSRSNGRLGGSGAARMDGASTGVEAVEARVAMTGVEGVIVRGCCGA